MNRFFGTATVSTPHLTAEGWSATMWKLESWIHLTWRKWINYAKYGKYCWALYISFWILDGRFFSQLFVESMTAGRVYTNSFGRCGFKSKNVTFFSFVLRLEFRWTQPRDENMDMLPKAHHALISSPPGGQKVFHFDSNRCNANGQLCCRHRGEQKKHSVHISCTKSSMVGQA